MPFTQLHDRVVVHRVESYRTTSGGKIIPEAAKEKCREGEVTSVGAGVRRKCGARIPMYVKSGDLVLFGKCSKPEIKRDGDNRSCQTNSNQSQPGQ